MIVITLLCIASALFFDIRWFSHHKFEYLEGVPASQQLDKDFWLGIALSLASLLLLFYIALS